MFCHGRQVSSAPRGSEVSCGGPQLRPEGLAESWDSAGGWNIVDLGLDSRSMTQLRRICFWFQLMELTEEQRNQPTEGVQRAALPKPGSTSSSCGAIWKWSLEVSHLKLSWE